MTVIHGKKVYRFAKLTPEREAKITEMVQLMKNTFDPLPRPLLRMEHFAPSTPDAPTQVNSTRLFCYVFLQAREWNVEKAFEMMKLSVAYRKENQLDERGEFPSAIPVHGWDVPSIISAMDLPQRKVDDEIGRIADTTRSFLEMGFHYWDRNGLPIFYMMLGSVKAHAGLKKLKQMAKVGETPLDLCWKVLQHIMGVGECLAFRQQKNYDIGALDVDGSEGHIRSCNIVLDMKGFTYRLIWKPAIDLMRSVLKRLFQYYPDCVHRIFVVNCPPTIMFGYKLIRPVIPVSVQRKVIFANQSETLEALSLLIDPRCIPERYGGMCQCEGGCFSAPHIGSAMNADESEGEFGDVMTEDITVTAGSDYCRIFDLVAEDTVVWEFAATHCKGVTFAVYFIPAAEAADMRWNTVSTKKLEPHVISKDHPLSGADTYVAKADGTLVLMWTNRKSWFSSKYVQLRVYKEAATALSV
ncbi:hypothetical protein ABL78_0071 [Leptomonas seymouri]|uniref:CRAL-TRIO domain-containing protein n=1 Tax=Leptomonas seymouri TaxID=5684 RepID=A0A0N1I2J8_LEPSE|nr:hypothetical protein ABL78_0071 [Leptomonas seymouri]|eukprot:KPI90838.1 hypothetical protein ABL78_0071 [Leptomonas seymouri]